MRSLFRTCTRRGRSVAGITDDVLSQKVVSLVDPNAGYSCVRGGCPTPAGDLMATHDARGRSTSSLQANPPHSRAPAPARAKAPMNCTPRPNGWTERLCAILPPTTLRTTCLPYRRLPLPAAPCRRSSTMPQGRIDPAPLASRTANRYVYSRAHWG